LVDGGFPRVEVVFLTCEDINRVFVTPLAEFIK
jgi:hypothetical protein